MRLAFDSSVLVAALVEPHSFHARTMPWLEAAAAGKFEAECSWHALAETWSGAHRLPLDPPVAPALAEVAIARLQTQVAPIAITGDHHRSALRRCSERGLRSGAIFDALHLVVAESRVVSGLVTFNPADFTRLATPDSPPILTPPDPPALMPLR